MNDKNENMASQVASARSKNIRTTVRVGTGTLSVLRPYDDGSVEYAPYIVKSGVSMAANLRQAFHELPLLTEHKDKALLKVSTPVALIPVDEYMDDEHFDINMIYSETFIGYEKDEKVANVLPDLNAVAIFAVNKDLKMVMEDNFADVRIMNVMQHVWTFLYRRSSLVTQRRKLYAYFHDGRVDVFSFMQRRFRFANSFDASHSHDALYYILFVWKQLAFSNEDDELHLVGETEYYQWLITKLKSYLQRVYTLSPSAELNRAPVSLVEGIDFDMMLS